MLAESPSRDVTAPGVRPFVGQSVRRVEDARLLTGASRFVDDLALPGTLHLVVIRSERAHARIDRLGLEAARALPGVAAVLTAEDLPPSARAIQFGRWLLPNPKIQATVNPTVRP